MLRTLANGNKPVFPRLSLLSTIPRTDYLFRNIELSDDIRGERLRFVEAMKEATAINVQSKKKKSPIITLSKANWSSAVHVEEFKKELTREVLISTQEVGRLQRERQLLEQQIADLFAFYSKQKQTVMVSERQTV